MVSWFAIMIFSFHFFLFTLALILAWGGLTGVKRKCASTRPSFLFSHERLPVGDFQMPDVRGTSDGGGMVFFEPRVFRTELGLPLLRGRRSQRSYLERIKVSRSCVASVKSPRSSRLFSSGL